MESSTGRWRSEPTQTLLFGGENICCSFTVFSNFSVQPRIYREERAAAILAVLVLAVQPDPPGQLLALHLPSLQRAGPGLPGSHSLVRQSLQCTQWQVSLMADSMIIYLYSHSHLLFSGINTSPGSGKSLPSYCQLWLLISVLQLVWVWVRL